MLATYNEIINSIYDEDIKDFTKNALDKNGSKELEKDACEVTKWLWFLLKEDKILNDNNYAVFIDILLAAAALHNISYKYGEEDYTKLFKARQMTKDTIVRDNLKLNQNYFDSIMQTIECQLGKNHPISLLIPSPNSPGSQFALACSLYYKTHNTVNDEDLI